MINTGNLGFVERKKGHYLSKLKGFNEVFFFFIKEASCCNRQKPLQKITSNQHVQLWSPIAVDTSTKTPTPKAQGSL